MADPRYSVPNAKTGLVFDFTAERPCQVEIYLGCHCTGDAKYKEMNHRTKISLPAGQSQITIRPKDVGLRSFLPTPMVGLSCEQEGLRLTGLSTCEL